VSRLVDVAEANICGFTVNVSDRYTYSGIL
jgi:hypothetical protein